MTPSPHLVRDDGAVHQRLTPGILVDTRLEGDERVITFARGAVVRELIVALDDETRLAANWKKHESQYSFG